MTKSTLKYVPMDCEQLKRFMKFTELDDNGCWNWTGASSGRGYGVFRLKNPRRQVYSHRLSYVTFVDNVRSDDVIHHVCENIKCVNPLHLEVTKQDWHMRQHKNGGAGNVCSKGHDLDVYGTFHFDRGSVKTRCRRCNADRQKRRRQRQKLGLV